MPYPRIKENTKVHLGMAYDKDATTLLILVSMGGGSFSTKNPTTLCADCDFYLCKQEN